MREKNVCTWGRKVMGNRATTTTAMGRGQEERGKMHLNSAWDFRSR